MCVLAFAWQAHPRWPILLAGNRDELHERPADPLARWTDSPILAGRDRLSGGTWLGVSEAGALAVVTNLRGFGAPDPALRSRGALVTETLAGQRPDPQGFNPFNLIAVDRGGARFLSNRPGTIAAALDHGLYGLSNGALDEPWPKTMRLKAILLDWMMGDAREPRLLLDGLREERVLATGLPPAQPSDVPEEPARSAIFIRDPRYGTRCSTVVAIDAEGQGLIVERRYAPDGAASGETALSFAWPSTGAASSAA